MSSALIRQALEFVDQEESGGKRRGRRGGRVRRMVDGKGADTNPYSFKNKKTPKEKKSSVNHTEENIKKLLALSTQTTDSNITEKIVQRAIKGKPLLDKIEVKVTEEKSILFPDEPPESFKKFESEYFCD